MSSRPIRFYHRGQVVEVGDAAPTKSVLDWLREDARCTGTKEGCNEGDCGACTVVIGTLAAPGDADAVRGLKLQTANACLQFLPTLDGKALFSVEDLKAIAAPGELHPVQQAMVECHGSQCGFCTPGFVMSLWSSYERHVTALATPTRQALADELSGNLCRCTGYRPILAAGERMFELPAAKLDTAPVLAALQRLASDETFEYGGRFFAPKTPDALATLREARPEARLLAGCTDVGLWVTKQFRELGEILYLGDVKALQAIEDRDGGLWIGAGASLEDAWRALATRWPSLTDVWLRFASPPIRRAGTMGGNVANGSPIGDSAPVLMALDAQIELRQGLHIRRMPLPDFYVDYMKNRLEPGEFVHALVVPGLPQDRQVRAYKISKRFDCDISALCAGFAVELDADRVRAVRLAFGGMAAVVKRAAKAEAALLGRPWTQDSVAAAQAALAEDFAPLSDMRASAAYRAQVAANLLQRFWLETRRADPLPASATSVFASMAHEEGPR
ncbi:xanthine dehydrogenase small subunit [uncultured Piscinibacter sp.]|uniref:xanthine dehydrogenase small subunit n=1 Tax=uncultured Piscinibacter sp. TaxID=1131835 RepID=UPI00260627F3|nr:xanthine dehydrogenase small subunit [uncultured Piscinibacter sp.]